MSLRPALRRGLGGAALAIAAATAGWSQGFAVPAAPPPSGPKLFGQQCGACHALAKGETRVGPSLAGLAGRVAGTLPGYAYSDALRKSGIRWDAATLDRWLADTAAAVPGSIMNYRQADPAKRKLVIDYLLRPAGG